MSETKTTTKTDIIKVSPSQILLFKRCPRAWYFKYVMKVKEPYRPWLSAGNDFHLCIEHTYMKIRGDDIKKKRYFDQEWIDLVNLGFEKEILTVPNNFLLEHPVKFEIVEGVHMNGIADFVNVSENKIEDHKTLKSWQYAETEETLIKNLQLMVYAYWYLKKLPKKKYVYLRHNQFHKNAPETSKFTEVKVSRKKVESFWETEVVPYVEQMRDLKTNTDENAFEYDLERCGDYGGCSFLGNCSVGVKPEPKPSE